MNRISRLLHRVARETVSLEVLTIDADEYDPFHADMTTVVAKCSRSVKRTRRADGTSALPHSVSSGVCLFLAM